MKSKKKLKQVSQQDISRVLSAMNSLRLLNKSDYYIQNRNQILKNNKMQDTIFIRAAEELQFFKKTQIVNGGQYYQSCKAIPFEPIEAKQLLIKMRELQRLAKYTNELTPQLKNLKKVINNVPNKNKEFNVKNAKITMNPKREFSVLWGLFKYSY